ncbi:MAG: phosphodiester glycosidase family protein [Oscillospiraceae bacterium]|nr:phosphodiester glycosidase family protein [Oscillospiraceae bacterium]
MEHEEFNFDEIMADLQSQLYDSQAQEREVPQQPVKRNVAPAQKKPSVARRVGRFLARLSIFLVVTVLLLVVALYGVMYVVAKGPSPTARDLFVMSVRETSAVGFLADLFFTEEEIAAIENKTEVEEYVETDTSLINIAKPEEKTDEDQQDTQEEQGPAADEWGLVDEDGDGIIVEPVKGEGYSGYMMVVLDPSRVIMGSVPTSFGGRGYTVEQMVQQFDAVAGINAGGFEDPEGKGNGSIPNTMVVYEGEVYYESKGVQDGFVGIDSNNILHVGKLTSADVKAKDIQYGVCFGPVLVANGEACDVGTSGVNPRTAIGQRSDGAILMLVIDGRQAISLGATYQDMVDIFLEYGAVNACNLDGGSSSLMWYDGDYINNCASVIGIRPVPTTFLVLKEGAAANE